MMIARIALYLMIVAVYCLSVEAVKDYCVSSSGEQYAVRDTWEEGLKLCECIYPESLLWTWDGVVREDAVPHCLFNGCPMLAKDGETFTSVYSDPSDTCTCTKGSSMMLADSYTLYHGTCSNGKDTYDVTFD